MYREHCVCSTQAFEVCYNNCFVKSLNVVKFIFMFTIQLQLPYSFFILHFLCDHVTHATTNLQHCVWTRTCNTALFDVWTPILCQCMMPCLYLSTLVISSLSVHTTFVDTDKPLGLHYTTGYQLHLFIERSIKFYLVPCSQIPLIGVQFYFVP